MLDYPAWAQSRPGAKSSLEEEEMEYTFEHDKERDVCVVRVSGENRRPEDSRVLQQFACDFRAENGCSRFLFDMREATIIGGTMDTYQTGTQPHYNGVPRGASKTALVYSGDMADHKFLETVVSNRGYVLRVFDDYDEAYAWLTASE
jgi:hypothetical protein